MIYAAVVSPKTTLDTAHVRIWPPCGYIEALQTTIGICYTPLSPIEEGIIMPLTTYESYLIVEQEYLTHWGLVNTALGGTPATDLKLSGNYAITNLTADRTAFQNAMDAVDNANNAVQVAVGNLTLLKNNLRIRLTQFRASVQFQLRTSGYFSALPTLPLKTAGQNATIDAYARMAQLWTQINADTTVPGFTPPLVLFGNYALAAFTTDLNALRAAYTLAESNRVKADVARGNRDVLIPPLRPRFQEYKAAIIAKLGANSALAKSVPTVSTRPGTTPQAVTLNGVWNTTQNAADLTISKATAADFARYEYRYSAGTKYDANTASVLAAQTNISILTLQTATGLGSPGLSIAVRCFVITDTGNEKGSNTVVITRP